MKKFLGEYWVEILALLIALFGVFLLVEQFEIRKSLYAAFTQGLDFLRHLASALEAGAIAYIKSFTLSDLVGWILIVLTGVFIFWRVRYRFNHSEHWGAAECPLCGSELHRVHRNLFDHLLARTLLPHARRYICENAECSWSGLRRYRRPESPDSDQGGKAPNG
jgi:hypothetical protein